MVFMVKAPIIDELRQMAQEHGMILSEEELKTAEELAQGVVASYNIVDRLPEPKLPVKYPRDTGRRPTQNENPLNAFAWTCRIKGASSGKLSGKRLGIKDNVSVAGIPMVNGSSVLEVYIADRRHFSFSNTRRRSRDSG
jgi:amidase